LTTTTAAAASIEFDAAFAGRSVDWIESNHREAVAEKEKQTRNTD
jgi:hypothetical protein